MTHPLIEDAGGEVLVEAEFEVDVRVEGAVGFAEQPALPVGVFFAKF